MAQAQERNVRRRTFSRRRKDFTDAHASALWSQLCRWRSAGVPDIALQCVGLLVVAGLYLTVPCVDGVEYFAGCEAIADALRWCGYIVKTYDIKKEADGSNDINSDKVYGKQNNMA